MDHKKPNTELFILFACTLVMLAHFLLAAILTYLPESEKLQFLFKSIMNSGSFIIIAAIIRHKSMSTVYGLIPAKSNDLIKMLALFLAFILIALAVKYLFALLGAEKKPVSAGITGYKRAGNLPLLIFWALAVGYNEELVFRVCISEFLKSRGLSILITSIVSSLLFALPHLWQGYSALVQAGLSGFLAAILYNKKIAGLHSLAWAHAAYNFTALWLA